MIPSEARGAFRELEARLRPWVARRVSSSSDTDDVLQEILVKLHRGAETLDDSERFGAWVYRIAERSLADHFRARARHPLARAPASDETAPLNPEGEEDLQRELAECVALFVAKLPAPYREAVTLTELEGMTQKEAAEMLGISLSGMKSRVQRGRARIREMFESCCELSVDGRGHVTSCSPRALDEVPDDCRAAASSWAARKND